MTTPQPSSEEPIVEDPAQRRVRILFLSAFAIRSLGAAMAYLAATTVVANAGDPDSAVGSYCRAGPAEVAITEFNFELWGAFQHGSNRTIDANSVVLVPIDEAFGYLTLSANSSAGDGVVVLLA